MPLYRISKIFNELLLAYHGLFLTLEPIFHILKPSQMVSDIVLGFFKLQHLLLDNLHAFELLVDVRLLELLHHYIVDLFLGVKLLN